MKYLIAILIFAYFGSLSLVYVSRHSLIYPFTPTRVAPADIGLPDFKEHIMQAKDSTPLIVWIKKARTGKPTIVYFHGNGGNLASRSQRFDRLARRGYGVIALAYRGSSGSKGRPSEDVITRDSHVLHDTLIANINGTVIYYGESLGTGVAIKLAKTHPPDAIILEAPYTSVTDRAAAKMPFFPIRQILDQRWDSIAHIKSVLAPTFVIHGTKDAVIPFSDGQTVFNAAPAKRKQFHKVTGGQHHDLWSVDGQTAIYAFIDSL